MWMLFIRNVTYYNNMHADHNVKQNPVILNVKTNKDNFFVVLCCKQNLRIILLSSKSADKENGN